MIALTRENEAHVVFAEAQIPSAIAAAFRNGQLRPIIPESDSPETTTSLSSLESSTERPTLPFQIHYPGRGLDAWKRAGGS